MTDKRMQMLWEVLHAARFDARRAALWLAVQGIRVTVAEADAALAEAATRNDLRLVSPADLVRPEGLVRK